MKHTLVKNTPANTITRQGILNRKHPLIGFEIPSRSNMEGNVGFLIPTSYFNRHGREFLPKRYVARSVSGFGFGNGWQGESGDDGKPLAEWLDWFAGIDLFTVHVFDTEKELFTWLAEESV
jgi:hypothetical protein